MEEINKYRPVLSIDQHELTGAVVSAWAAPVSEKGTVKTVSQKIHLNNYRDFFSGDDAVLQKIFQALHDISDESLVSRFGARIKNGNKLSSLLQDEKIKPALKNFLAKKLDTILQLAISNNILLCQNIIRNGYITDHLLTIPSSEAVVHISLQKTDSSVIYRLAMNSDGKVVSLKGAGVSIITNNPAWVVINRHLYNPAGINGNMLLPFVSKDEVIVPDRLVPEYFKTFVMKLDASVEIEAEGFDVIKYDTPQSAELQLVESVFEGKYVLKLSSCYNDQSFDYNDLRRGRKKLDISPEGKISIIHYIRNAEKENHFAELLTNEGIVKLPAQTFALPDEAADDVLAACEWLRSVKVRLQKLGFRISAFYLGEMPVNLENFDVKNQLVETGDWFDVNVQVQVGEFSFPFKKLVPNLRNDDRSFVLPDGSVFIIPKMWFSKYASLIQLGTESATGFRLSKAQKAVADDFAEHGEPEKLIMHEEIPAPTGLNASLRPYQLAGFQWLAGHYNNNLGACLADDMGLGKTLQSIALLLHISSGKTTLTDNQAAVGQLDLFAEVKQSGLRALVVLPASLVFNWAIEFNKFAPQLTRYIHTGAERHRSSRMIEKFEIVLTTYHVLVRDIDELSKIAFDAVILDESQQIKNKDSKMFEAVSRLSAGFRLTLTGTPIENSLSDLWAQMQFINPGILGSAQTFRKAFQQAIERDGDESKRDELLRIVGPFILRRTKKSVAPELPELTEFVHYCEMSKEQAEIYEKEKSAVRNTILMAETESEGRQKLQILNALQRLRQIASHPAMLPEYADVSSGKFEEVSYFLENAQRSKEKVLVFSSYVRHLDKYCEWAKSVKVSYSRLTGDVAQSDRKTEVENFQEKDIPWFFLSLKAGGTGLNLTAAEYVFLIDPWWNPAAEQQAIARAHRIGQNRNVTAIRFITRNTIEEKILGLQQRKQKLAEDIIQEDEFFLQLSNAELSSLLD